MKHLQDIVKTLHAPHVEGNTAVEILDVTADSRAVKAGSLFIALDGNTYKTLAAAQAAGASTVNYGLFITGLLNFIIMAFVIFMIVKAMNKLRSRTEKPVEEKPTKKICPYCQSEISIKASRCPHCTSQLEN